MQPSTLSREEGETVWKFDALDTIKADEDRTDGGFSLIEILDFEGSWCCFTSTRGRDRGFYVLEGEYTFLIADNSHRASAGTWIFVPRKTPHARRTPSDGVFNGRTLCPDGTRRLVRPDRGLGQQNCPRLSLVSRSCSASRHVSPDSTPERGGPVGIAAFSGRDTVECENGAS